MEQVAWKVEWEMHTNFVKKTQKEEIGQGKISMGR
jgi:hypothetical protein